MVASRPAAEFRQPSVSRRQRTDPPVPGDL